MNRRPRRIALLTVAAGCLVVGGLVAFNWSVVRNHVEAWRFVMTRRTSTAHPMATFFEGSDPVFQYLAHCFRRRVIFDRQAIPNCGTDASLASLYGSEFNGFSPPLTSSERQDALATAGGAAVLDALRSSGYRIIEQRFPSPAYVVVEYPVDFLHERIRELIRGFEPKVTTSFRRPALAR